MLVAAAAAEDTAELNRAGVAALTAGNLKAALADFQKAARLDPHNSDVQFNLGLTLVRSGRPDQALAPLQLAAADPKTSDEAKYLLGTCYFELMQHEKAAAVLQGLTNGSRAEHVLYMIEESNRMLGRPAQARDAFRELNRRFPDGAWTHYLLGVAYENQAQLDKAIEEYKAALARDPKLPNAAFAIGYIYWRQRDAESAKTFFEKQLESQPCHALSIFYLGQIARADQNAASAATHFRRALACDADSPETHLRLGMTLAEMNQDREALEELKRAVALAPDNPTAHYRLALLYKKLGRAEESRTEYATVRRLRSGKAPEASEKP